MLCVLDAYRDASASVVGPTPYLLDHLGKFTLSTRLMILAILRLAVVLETLKKMRCDIKDVSLVRNVSLLTYSVM